MDTNATQEYYSKKLRVRKSYKKQLMLSEWLVQVPDDLFTAWKMVPVPEGKVMQYKSRDRVFPKEGVEFRLFVNSLYYRLAPQCTVLYI